MRILRAIFGKFFGKRGVRDNQGAKSVKIALLIFGLGNPGSKYSGTRHNIGFDVIDKLCAILGDGVSASKICCEAECRSATVATTTERLQIDGGNSGGNGVLLVKPFTYMNLSGDAVGALIDKHGLTVAESLVIVDDFNIPLGKIRFRKEGSPGGHNGLKSISAAIGDNYPRLRVGVGPLPAGVSIIDFVLGSFEERERDNMEKSVKTAAEAVMFMVENGIDNAMNKYN